MFLARPSVHRSGGAAVPSVGDEEAVGERSVEAGGGAGALAWRGSWRERELKLEVREGRGKLIGAH